MLKEMMGQELKLNRDLMNRTQEELAQTARISQSLVNKIEKGRGGTYESVEMYANAVGKELILGELGCSKHSSAERSIPDQTEGLINCETLEPMQEGKLILCKKMWREVWYCLIGFSEIFLLIIVYAASCFVRANNAAHSTVVLFEGIACVLFFAFSIISCKREGRNWIADTRVMVSVVTHTTLVTTLSLSPLLV